MVTKIQPPLVGRYQVLHPISAAADSKVFLARDLERSGTRCALKVFRLTEPGDFEAAQRVFNILRKVHHRGIAEPYDFGRLDAGELAAAGIQLAPRPRQAAEREKGAAPAAMGWLAGRGNTPPELLAYVASTYYRGLNIRDAFLFLFENSKLGEPGGDGGGADRKWRIFLEAVARLCEALDAVHARDIIHFDIKVENVLLIPQSEPGPIERFDVKLLDFDLSERKTTPVGTRLRGSFPFVAPELFESATADRRSDLFSLGVTLALAVSGQVPFVGSRPKEWVEAARAGKRRPVDQLCPGVPDGVSKLIDSLLERDPSRRPPTAGSLIPRLEALGGFHLSSAPKPPSPFFPTVGWERELELVRAEIQNMKRGESDKALILVEGDQEQFLDRFVDEVETVSRAEGVRIECGRSRLPREFAYQPFGEMICKILDRTPDAETRFARFLPVLSLFCPRAANRHGAEAACTDRGARKTLAPLTMRLEAYRFLDLITEFFLEVTKDAPLVLCVRDIERAGRENMDVIRAIARNVHLRSRRHEEGVTEPCEPARLLVIATLRNVEQGIEEPDVASRLATINEVAAEPYVLRLTTRNLALDELPGWLRQRVPQLRLDGESLRRLHDKSHGSVAFLEEFVRRLPEGVSQADTPLSLRHVLLRLPRKALDAALERFHRLRDPERRPLEILAAAGGGLAVDVISRVVAAGGTTDAQADVSSHLDKLGKSGLVEIRETVLGRYAAVTQPALARRVYQQLPEDVRAALHRELAHALLQETSARSANRVPEDIALHALGGGDVDLFTEQGLRAADRLAATHAVEAATQLYETILEHLEQPIAATTAGTPDGTDGEDSRAERPRRAEALRGQISEKLADIYTQWEQLPKAIERLTIQSSAREVLASPLALGSVFRKMGEVFRQSGELASAAHFLQKSTQLLRTALEEGGDDGAVKAREEHLLSLLALARLHAGREHFQEAMARLQQVVDAGNEHAEVACRARILLAEILQKEGRHAESAESYAAALSMARGEDHPVLLLDVLRNFGSSLLALGQYDRAIECFEEALEVAGALESKFDMAACNRSIGTIYHDRALHEKALQYFNRSLLLSSQIGDMKGVARSYNNLGIVYRLRDDWTRAAQCYRLAIDLFSHINDKLGMATGMNNLATILELEGKYDEALEYSFRALDKRKKTRSRSGMAFSYYGIGKIYQSKGELDRAVTYAEKSAQLRRETGEKLGTAYSSLLLAELSLAQEKYAEALDLCRQSLEDFESLENEVGVLMARGTLAHALLLLGSVEEAKTLLESTLKDARRAGQETLAGTCLQHLGRIAMEEGDLRQAAARLAEAEGLLRARQNRRKVAWVLLAQAEAALESKQADRAADTLEEAYSILEELGIRDLVPFYFLLRGRLEMQTYSAEGNLENARNYLERGLMEAREVSRLELRARLLYILGTLELRQGDAQLASMHFQEARDILEDFHNGLPPELRVNFYQLREREEIRTGVSSLPAYAPRDSRASPPEPDTTALETPLDEKVDRKTLAVQLQMFKLHEVAAAMGSEPDLKKLLETVMDAVLELVDAERGFLILKGRGTEVPAFTVARNLDHEEILTPEKKVSDSVSRQVLRTGKPVVMEDAIEDERFLSSRSIRNLRVRSLVCLPLRFRGETLGIVYLDNRHRRGAFSQKDCRMLEAFADQAAVAVTNARLIAENRRRSTELQDINRKVKQLNVKLRRKVHRKKAQLARAREDLHKNESESEDRSPFQDVLGSSEAMQEVFFLLEKVSETQIPVLVEGESGTGKDLVARAIHANSPQREAPFIRESCGALTETLFETELFGHTRGAFTGAVAAKKGLFELAHKGTLFLDDVEDLSLAMQQKLLRVLEEKEIRRVGDKEIRPVEVRIIAATSRDLTILVEQGTFRADLFYRLNGMRIRLPPLRERKEDIPVLVERFVKQASPLSGEEPRRFGPAAIRALMNYDWPGNVRELRHLVARTLLVAPEPVIRKDDIVFDPQPIAKGAGGEPLPSETRVSEGPSTLEAGPTGVVARAWETVDSLQAVRNEAEKDFVAWCLRQAEGNVSAAAKRCRVSRESMYRLLRKHGLRPGR